MRKHRKVRSTLQKSPNLIGFNAAVLAGAIALVLPTSADANTYIVNSTADSGPGTLRQAVLDADASAGPHTITFALPAGSTIALSSGQLALTGPDIAVNGPGQDSLTISGNHASRIFDVEAGSLTIDNLTLRDGLALGDATNLYDQAGGAIRVGALPPPLPPGQFKALLAAAHDAENAARVSGERTRASRSAGLMAIRRMQALQPQGTPPLALTVDHVALINNRAEAPDRAIGGAISLEGGATLVMRDSVLSGNSTSFAGGAISALGGSDLSAPYASAGTFDIRNTTFSTNHVDMNGTEPGQGAALLTYGPGGSVRDSVFRDNVINDAPPEQPAMDALGGALELILSTLSIDIDNTEISDNSIVLRHGAYAEGAGVYCYAYPGNATPLTVTNSTISGNRSQIGAAILDGCNLQLFNTTIADNISHGIDPEGHSGNAVHVVQAAGLFNAQSTLIANPASDFDLLLFRGTANLGIVSNSLILAPDPSAPPLPPDTIIGVDPMLLPLAYNGGPTQTQALPAGSVAIDAGSNPQALPFDQRGAPYARVVGAAADIGAYELDGDRIFANGFD